MKALVRAVALALVAALFICSSSAHSSARSRRTLLKARLPSEMAAGSEGSSSPGGSEDSAPQISTQVYARGSDGESTMNRVWDDEQGGSTIMLTNRNSLEAWERMPRNKKPDNFLTEVKREQAKEAMLLAQARQALQQKKQLFQKKLQDLKQSATQQLIKSAQANEANLSKLVQKVFTLKKGKLVAENNQIIATNQRTYMFWIKPRKVSSEWANIIQKGDKGGDRAPAIFFYPNSFRLHVRSASVASWNDGANPDPPQQLERDTWTHVAFTHKKAELKVYLNGAVVSTTTTVEEPANNYAAVYACGNDYDCADALLADLRFYSRVLSESEVLAATQEPFDQTSSTSLLSKPSTTSILPPSGSAVPSATPGAIASVPPVPGVVSAAPGPAVGQMPGGPAAPPAPPSPATPSTNPSLTAP